MTKADQWHCFRQLSIFMSPDRAGFSMAVSPRHVSKSNAMTTEVQSFQFATLSPLRFSTAQNLVKKNHSHATKNYPAFPIMHYMSQNGIAFRLIMNSGKEALQEEPRFLEHLETQSNQTFPFFHPDMNTQEGCILYWVFSLFPILLFTYCFWQKSRK